MSKSYIWVDVRLLVRIMKKNLIIIFIEFWEIDLKNENGFFQELTANKFKFNNFRQGYKKNTIKFEIIKKGIKIRAFRIYFHAIEFEWGILISMQFSIFIYILFLLELVYKLKSI